MATILSLIWDVVSVAIVLFLFATLATVCLPNPRGRRAIATLLRTIVAILVQFVERKVITPLGIPLKLPRDMSEVEGNPAKFESLLVRGGVLAKGTKIQRLSRLQSIKTEPKKNSTAGAMQIEYLAPEASSSETLKVFMKFQTGRGMPWWLQALRTGAEPGIAREVDFYSKCSGAVPLRTPKAYLARKLPLLNYVFVVLEWIDLEKDARVIPDHQGANLEEVNAMMHDVAKMHAAFSHERVSEDPATSWIPAHAGLEYLKFLDTFMDKKDPVWPEELWDALKRRFVSRPVTLIHGDCRPGNMMFVPHSRDRVDEVIFADWEACNVGPLLWDLTYCTVLGWPGASRRAHQREALSTYVTSIRTKTGPIPAVDMSMEEALLDVECLTLVLALYSRTIRKTGFWNNQGNEEKDQVAWLVRVALAVSDLNAERVADELMVDAEMIQKVVQDAREEVERLCKDRALKAENA